MARSIYGAAAEGLESGFGLGLRARAEERATRAADDQRIERAQDRATAATREAKADERLAKQDKRLERADERQARLDELSMLDKEGAELTAEGQALFGQYGGYDKVPADVRDAYTGRVKDVRSRRAAARQSFYKPTVESTQKEAAELWSRLETKQVQLAELTPDQLYKAIQVQARRPMSDFQRGKDGKPSVIEQAAMDLEAGVQTGNEDLILRAANELLKPELSVGVGSEGRDGSEIISKRIVKMAPHPQDPEQLVPIVEVTVKRDDGATGKYLAPVSEGRGVYANDPQAMPKTISVQQAFDRVGQLAGMAEFVNHPTTAKELAKAGAGKAEADEFLKALGMMGVQAPKKQITRERVELGGHVLERDVGPSGEILGERRLGKTPTPRAPGEGAGAPTAEERNIAAKQRRLQQAVKEGRISQAEMDEQIRRDLLGGGKGAMTSPADLFKAENTLRDEHSKQSQTFVKIRDAFSKVNEAAKNPNAASDIALIFSYMRILDPESVVREGEFATAEKARGVPDTILNTYNRLLKGERLNNEQRAKFVGEAKKVYDSQRRSQDKLDKTYRGLADRYGLNAENIVQDLALDDPAAQLPQAARAALKEGQVTTFGNGQKWTLQGGQPVQVQ